MSSSRSTCSPGSSQDAPRGRMSSSTPRPVAWLTRKTLAQHSHLAPSLQHGVPRYLGSTPPRAGLAGGGGGAASARLSVVPTGVFAAPPPRRACGKGASGGCVGFGGPDAGVRLGLGRRGTLWGWLLAGHPGVGRLLVLLVRVEEQDQHEADQRGEHGEQDGGRLAVDERLLGGGDELLGLGVGELLGDLLGAGERLADGRRRLLGQLLGLLWGGGRRTPW